MLDTDSAGFIQDYSVNGRGGAPAALYPELALAVSEAMWPGNPATVHHLELIRPLLLGGHGRCWMQVNLCVEGERSGELRISSRENEQAAWTLHATCQLGPAKAVPGSQMLRARLKTTLDRANNVSLPSDLHFAALERCGVSLGPSCRTLRELESEPAKGGASSALVARMMLPRVSESEWYSYRAHPAILEGCLQLVGTLLEPAAAVRVMALGEITFNGELGSDCWCRVSRRESGPLGGRVGDRAPEVVVADLEFFDRQGLPIGWIEGVQVEALSEQAEQRTGVSKGLHRIDWVSADSAAAETKREVSRWIIVSDSAAEAASLAAELEKRGGQCFFCEKIEDLEPLVDRLHADALAPWGLVLLAWSESGFDGPSGALAHRAFRIASWAAAIRGHRGDASEVWLATRGVQSVRTEEGRPVETGTLVAREIDTFASCAEMLQCRHFDASARLEYAERVSLAGLMGRGDLDRQFVARGEEVFVPRLATIDLTAAGESSIRTRSLVPAEDRNFRAIHTGVEGLECLALVETEEPEGAAGDLLIEVRSAALSQFDVLTGLGLARRSERGHGEIMQNVARDFSGVVRAVSDSTSAFEVGDEVIGIHAGAFSRRLVVPSDFVVRKPSFFDFHEAASVPFPFLVAKYALQVVARLRAGERILILSAAGGIGQALIQVARSVGAEVNATASTPEKCAVLRQLGARVLDFGLEATPSDGTPAEGLGDFDVIVSANSGSTMHAMLARLAAEGRYIDLCPRARFERPELGALRLGANRSVSAIDIGEMIQTEPTLVSALLEQIAEDANRGRVQPIKATVFNVSEGARALRFMAQNRHTGRVCVDLADARQTLVRPDVKPGTELAGRGVFVVSGMMGGAVAGVHGDAVGDVDGRTESDENELEIGSAVATWLRDHGADEVIELGSRESDGVVATIRRQGLRLGGWVQVVSETDRRPDESPPFWTAGPVVFCALVSVRESAGDDRDRNRAWETRLTVDRLLLSNTRNADRSIGISVGRDVAPERVIRVLEKAIVDDLPESQVVVLSDDDLSARLAEAPSPILAELRQGSESRQRSHLLRAELLSLTPPERRTTMQQFVCETLAGVLGLSEEQRLALDVGSQLDAVGLDSLMTMELFMGLGRDLDLDIAADWFDSVPSLAAIAAVLVERLEEAASTAEDS